MKKRLISLIVVAVFCALLMPNLSACSIGVEDLAGYVASIENASAVGIGKMSVTKSSVKARANAQAGVMAVPVTLDNVSSEQTKDYLLTATETEDGYEYEKLSFTKIVNSLFGEVKGEKEYVSADGTLSFFANKGFKYTVLFGGEEIFSEIEDNSAEDENKKQGVITLSGLEEGETYVVRHRGKGKEKVLTQDEMKARVRRVYVSENFTFIELADKSQGDYVFSRDNFISSDYDKVCCFVIDNESGRVYSLKGIFIFTIYDGMVVCGKPKGGTVPRILCDLSVNENDELVFTPIITNENLGVGTFFKDKYGRKYIQVDNEQLDGYYDENFNAFFWFSKDKDPLCVYRKNSNGEAVRVEKSEVEVTKKNGNGGEYKVNQEIDKLYVIDENGKERELNEEDNFYLTGDEINRYTYSISNDLFDYFAVENGWVKYERLYSGEIKLLYNYLSENDLKYYEFECPYERVDIDINEIGGCDPVLFDDGIFFVMRNADLCYGKNLWESMKNQTEVEYTIILSGCTPCYEPVVGFKKMGINGEVYYTVKETFVGGKRMYEAVEAGSYEGNATSFTLQPLNR